MSTVEQDEDLREPIGLPNIEWLTPVERNGPSSSMYGAAAVAATYCGFKAVPSAIRGIWMHGCSFSYRAKLHPDLLLGLETKPENYYWVARKDEEHFLRKCGYKKVSAIGLPLIYLPAHRVRRRPGSLLVMPVHSTDYTTHSWKFDEYAEAITAIRSQFTEVVVCVHPACWKRGYWVDAFRQRGFPLVVGADFLDRNALKRVQCLMSGFEYVTTNCFGSQLAYAAYLGAKPSVYGPYSNYRLEDFSQDPLYVRHPELLEPTIRSISEEELRRNVPRLFCHPREAKADVEWGRFEVGESNKVSPRKMRSLFGWNLSTRVSRSLKSKIPRSFKHRALMYIRPSYGKVQRETARLLAMPPHQPTCTTLLGPKIEVQDAPSFVWKKYLLFDQELYRFNSTANAPRIIDCGAGVGLSVCYFKRLYPKSEITAFEPDPCLYEILKRNCESWGAKDVRLVRKAVWNCESTVTFSREDVFPGRICERAVGNNIHQVQTCRLRDQLSHGIDLLRLNIEGAEVDVLLDCADLLGQVQNLIVDYHSVFGNPQRLDTLMGLLTKAGFRMHFRATSDSSSPLLFRAIHGGVDSKLHIFAFRV